MEKIFKKYEFDSQEQAETRIGALPTQELDGETFDAHQHVIVKLGYLWVTEPTYDAEGNVETEGVASTSYSVDVLWNKEELLEDGEVSYPYGWVSKEITVEGNGVHTFLGRNYE